MKCQNCPCGSNCECVICTCNKRSWWFPTSNREGGCETGLPSISMPETALDQYLLNSKKLVGFLNHRSDRVSPHFLKNDRVTVRVFYSEELEPVWCHFRTSAFRPRFVSSWYASSTSEQPI